MLWRSFFRSPRLFLYLGFGLILSALVCLPVQVSVVVQPDTAETQLWHVGPIIALLLGAWSLPSLFLGVMESSTSKKAALLWLIAILVFANVVLALLLWDIARYARTMMLQSLISYGPFLAALVITDVIAFLYLTIDKRLTGFLKNMKARMLLTIAFTAVPPLIVGLVLYFWTA